MKELKIVGDWFVPSNKEKRVSGTLIYSPIEGSELEIYGSFDDFSDFMELSDNKIILGLTSKSEYVTLYNCMMTKSGGMALKFGNEVGKTPRTYSPLYVFIGAHIEKEEDFLFETLTSQILHLDDWVGINGFINKSYEEMKSQIENHEIEIKYRLPNPIKFTIDENVKASINFIAKPSSILVNQKIASIKQIVTFNIKTKNSISFTDLLKHYFTFQNFITLALYQDTYPICIELKGKRHKTHTQGGEQYLRNITLYFSIRNFNSVKKDIDKYELLFNYHSIKQNFKKIIKNWYEKYEKLEPAFDLVFEQFYNKNGFNVNSFLNLAQASETFHSRLHNHTKIPRADYIKMKEDIINLTPEKYHTWLKEQFNFGNNLNLHIRLSEIVDNYTNKILEYMIGDKEKFVKAIKDSRNYYTHYSKGLEKKALKNSELFYFSQKLKILLVCAFLEEAGIKKTILEKTMNTLKYRMFAHLADWKNYK